MASVRARPSYQTESTGYYILILKACEVSLYETNRLYNKKRMIGSALRFPVLRYASCYLC